MIQIAVMGFGTVGSGVVEVLTENAESIARNAGAEINVKYILDVRDFPESPFSDRIIHDFNIIEDDPEVSIVVETIGGAGVAYNFTKRALASGKSVVTANKELVAKKGHELLSIAEDENVNYLFEASVGGGIPIIRPITQCLAANEFDQIYGILNGTTNYILTQMLQKGESFDDALKKAQELGYAELDPSADVDGIDACRKICILADLCFGRHIDPAAVRTEGIRGVTAMDVKYAGAVGCKIKLLGRAVRMAGGTSSAYVSPHLISCESLLSNVDGVMNAIVVNGNAIGEAMFYGAGAGKRPTASAVVADVIDAVKHSRTRKYLHWDEGGSQYFTDADEISSRWYIRTDSPLSRIGDAFGNVRLISVSDAPENEYAFTTPSMTGSAVKLAAGGINVLSMFRILD